MKNPNNAAQWLGFAFLMLGAATIWILSWHYFSKQITGIVGGKPVENELWYAIVLRIHIIGGLMAIALGPPQFIASLRKKYITSHRQLGVIYFFCVFSSGVAGLIIAQYAIGGMISTLGFSALSTLWLITGIAAVRAIKRRDIPSHQKWMYYNYALTFSAIPQRTMLALALVLPIPFVQIYQASSWFSWMFNLCVAFFLIKKIIKT